MNDARVTVLLVVLIVVAMVSFGYLGYKHKLNSTPNGMKQIEGSPKTGYMIQTCIMYSRGNEAYLNCDNPTKS